jgi:hypothetical protein
MGAAVAMMSDMRWGLVSGFSGFDARNGSGGQRDGLSGQYNLPARRYQFHSGVECTLRGVHRGVTASEDANAGSLPLGLLFSIGCVATVGE